MTRHISSSSSLSLSLPLLFEGSATASRAGALRRPYKYNIWSDEASHALQSSGWEDDGDGSGDDRRGARRGGGRGGRSLIAAATPSDGRRAESNETLRRHALTSNLR